MAETLQLVVELVALFFGVTLLVQLAQRRWGPERLRVWMGGRPAVAAIKGIGVGFITPFCTFTAIPVLIGLRQAGVAPAGYVAFITAAPVLDPVLFGALVLIVGPAAAVIYAVVAFVAAAGLALTAQRVGIEAQLKPVPAELAPPAAVPIGSAGPAIPPPSPAGASGCAADDQEPWLGLAVEVPRAARSGVRLLRSIAPLLAAGVTIGLAIEALVSPDAVAAITGEGGGWSIPLAAVLGTPLYFDTSLFVPIADSLTRAGVGIGAIVALTIAGAGANVPEFLLLSKLATARLVGVFLTYVFAVAVIGGVLAEALVA